MNTLEFLSRLRKLGVNLSVEDQKLRLNAPQGVLTPSLKAELKDRKIELLNFLREQQHAGFAAPPPIRPIERSSAMSLSFAQQRLWFLTQMEPEHPVYNVPMAFRLSGLLSIEALSQSFADMIARHEILRTTFSTIDDQPVQIINKSVEQPLSIIDFQHLPEDKREIEVQNTVKQEITRHFDLENGPLFRTKLLRLAPSEHILLILTHHIVFDGWSYEILCRELTNLYISKVAGQPQQLPKLPIQYADFAHWQIEWLQGEVLENLISYWRQQLDGVPVLQLPADHPRPAVQTYRGAHQSFLLSKTLAEALNALSHAEGATLFMTLMAAFNTLLYRYTGQEDIVVGSPIANRNRVEVEGLIGFFVNTLAIRTDLSVQPSFRELLGRVRETALGAFAHQDMPFEKLVEELSPERDLSRNAVFQVFFNHIATMDDKGIDLPGIEAEAVEGLNWESKFDMTLHVLEGESGIEGKFVYNTDLFDTERIERMVGHFQTLLEGIVADPDQRISDVPILTDAERQQLLIDWNDTSSEYPHNRCVHQLFEQQVEKSPDTVAVIYGNQQLTYRELNTRANQLGHYLNKLGVGPEVLVGICIDRSLEMIIGLMGVLKAGGAYMPLDPAYPKERLQYMVNDSGSELILTSRRLMDLVNSLGEVSTITLDSDDYFIENIVENDINLSNVVCPDNLAYVLYTSGSTGLPKGTLIEHKSLVNYLCWINTGLLEDDELHIPLITKLTFDASLKQLFAPLLRDGEVWILPDDVVTQPAGLLQAIAASSKVGLNCIPSLWEAILDVIRIDPDKLTKVNLSHLFVGGERLSQDLVNKSFATLPKIQIWNLYGPTETTANASVARIISMSDVTIGRPIANTKIYILDPYLQLTPVGISGELHIGGDGLARGYLNRPGLTAERFIPNPFSDKTGARLYKTGDLARFLPDGNIEFLGRLDYQVKVRGYRIEIGEVEAVLGQHPAVRQVIVQAREDIHGDKRLVAYLLLEEDCGPTTTELGSFLKKRLPDFMIPTAFVFLDLFPLTPNGKVDRRALPAPDRNRSKPAEVHVAPRNELELQLTKIWEKVLGIKNVGIKDNFFDLGGHSLLVVQLFARIQKIFGKDLPLTTLFQAPTIEQLTSILRQEKWSSPWSSLAPIQHSGSKPPFFCVHGCTGKVLHFFDLVRLLGPEQPFYGLSALGLEKGQVPYTQFEDMAAHYIKELRTIQFNGPYYIGGSGDGCAIALEMAHQLELQGQDVTLLVLMTPGPSNPNKSYNILSYYYNSLKNFFRLLIGLMKKRPILPNIWHAFLNRLLWHWSIFHRFLPNDIHRWRRFMDDFSKARKSYKPKPYRSRITYFLREKYSHDHKKLFGKWYDLAVGGLDIRFVPGTIISMWQEPHVQILAEQLKACLEEAQTNNEGSIDTIN